MAAKKTKEEENPLFKQNIPPPPTTAPVTTQSQTAATRTGAEENGSREKPPVKSSRPAPAASTPKSTERNEEKATIELSLYLRPSQDEKLEDLRRAYKRHTGKKISANEVMRRLIEQATLDTLLEASE
jgi:hypothetical protein